MFEALWRILSQTYEVELSHRFFVFSVCSDVSVQSVYDKSFAVSKIACDYLKSFGHSICFTTLVNQLRKETLWQK